MILDHKTGKLLGIAIKEAKRSPIILKETANITTQEGVEGDHRGMQGRRQVTVVSKKSWEKVCEDLNQSLPWIARRANLLVNGIEFKNSTGQLLQIGELVLKITGETEPCHRMDEFYQGLQDALKPEWRGGVTCKVIKSGRVKIDDVVTLSAAAD
jgi:MOSC domain-containing protein YiiM